MYPFTLPLSFGVCQFEHVLELFEKLSFNFTGSVAAFEFKTVTKLIVNEMKGIQLKTKKKEKKENWKEISEQGYGMVWYAGTY